MLTLTKPTDPRYRYFLLYNDHHNRFHYKEIRYSVYTSPIYTNTMLGVLPTYIPAFLEKPLLYYQYIPFFF